MIANLSKKHLPKIKWQKLLYGTIVTLPVIAYVFKFAVVDRNGVFRGEDWDYFAQAYEAARLTILHYHQFPWWNPWMDGGQPLFANPQFGLFSIQMPLVLLFGTVAGLHYSMLVYFVLGFWGMYLLLQRIGSKSKLLTVLLSYIWIFSGFNVGHLAGGQYTFTMYLLAPWAFLTMLNIHKKRGWLWFGLVASLMILTAMHYLTFEALLICILIAVVQIIRKIYVKHSVALKNIFPILKPYIFALVLVLILCGVRMFYTFQFTHEFTRLESLDPPESLKLFLASLIFRSGLKNPGVLTYSGKNPYGWIEYADYFGLTTIALFCYLVVVRFERIKSVSLKEWLIVISIILAALITLGSFSSISPYSILHHLPIFNQMRVPYRFVGWVVFGIILFLVKLPPKKIVYVFLVLAVVDVFAANYSLIDYNERPYTQAVSTSNQFEQYAFFETSPNLGQSGINNLQNLRLLRATQENYGNVYGYEPVLNIGEYYYLPGTVLCGVDIDQKCKFVLTSNAIETYWSPGKITLKRTAGGPIALDMNPGRVWRVNGQAIFPDYKILELQDYFILDNPTKTINIVFHPVL